MEDRVVEFKLLCKDPDRIVWPSSAELAQP